MLALESRPLDGRNGHEAGRALLRQMVEQLTGTPMPPVEKTPMGKPYFVGSKLQFSISHTKTHVFCALSDRPIGIDAEELTRQVDLRLAEKILSEHELACYRQASDKNRALLTFWVLKEAAAKCTGRGLQGFPNRTNFSLTDTRVRMQEGCLVAVIEEEDDAV